MKFKCDGKNFTDAVRVVSGSVARRVTLPVLTHVLIEAEKRDIKFTASDRETRHEIIFSGEIESRGAVCVPYDVLSRMPVKTKEIDFELSGNRLQINCGGRYDLLTLPPDDFVDQPEYPDSTPVDMPLTKDMIELLPLAANFVNPGDSRQVLSGVNLEIAGGRLAIFGTDGKKMAWSEFTVENLPDCNVVITPRTAGEIGKFQDGANLRLYETRGIEVSDGRECFKSKLIAGKYPNARQIIPKSHSHQFTVDPAAMRNVINDAVIVNPGIVTVNVAPGVIKVSGKSSRYGEAEATTEIDYDGPEAEFRFLPDYLLRCVGLPGEKFTVKFNDAFGPVWFSGTVGEAPVNTIIVSLRKDAGQPAQPAENKK